MVSLDDPAVRAAYDDEQLPRMSFGDHLDELRKRLIRSLLAVVVAIAVVMPFKHTVQEIILAPYRLQWQRGFTEWVEKLEARQAAGTLDKEGKEFLAYCLEYRESILAGTKEYTYLLQAKTGFPVPYGLFAIEGLEDILNWMWVALLFAVVLASPVVIWQIWAFVAAGLYQRERRIFYRYFPFMMLLLLGGILFGYRVALPFSLHFLIGLMDPSQVGAMLSIGQFLNLELALTGALGLVFQLPLVMVALQRVGLVRHTTYLKHWRMTVLLIFLVAALLTPPEPVSMLLMAAPMLLLYGLGLLLTWIGRGHEAPATEVSP
ncbi:MAG: twin-arginine translocase subunit TatC [Planctomycetes bacterium]|nr:twin-arginine translocase subunit TatC [Planctomycetota bacterium]